MGEQAAATFNFARDIVERWAQLRPREPALWCVDEDGVDRRFNFAELVDLSRRASHLFHQAGIRRGDRVLVMLPRVPMWWIG
jgi:acyl-coenzyme A synthetase/AMP-(fatty) acid ligase